MINSAITDVVLSNDYIYIILFLKNIKIFIINNLYYFLSTFLKYILRNNIDKS